MLSGTRAKASTIIGTPENLSPEVLCGKNYNSKSDIWSLGILLYKMAALERPWPINSINDALQFTQNCRYPPLPATYSNGLKNIVQMCMQKSPGQRPSINALLAVPVINRRIRNYLNDLDFREEFSHTILHN